VFSLLIMPVIVSTGHFRRFLPAASTGFT